jgi:hypothetical protein
MKPIEEKILSVIAEKRREIEEALEKEIDNGVYTGPEWPKETIVEVNGWNEGIRQAQSIISRLFEPKIEKTSEYDCVHCWQVVLGKKSKCPVHPIQVG